MKLTNLLINIKSKTKEGNRLLAAPSGVQFENQIIANLTSNKDYISVTKFGYRNLGNYKEIKNMIIGMQGDEEMIVTDMHNELTMGRNIVIYQPHGSQSYPDILLMRDGMILPIECKFSTKGGQKPTWNGGLPRSGGIYIFGSYDNRDITYFKGEDYLTSSEREAMIYAFNKAEAMLDSQYTKSEWSLYLRRMYNQNFSSLSNPRRVSLEENAIATAAKFENYK